MKENKTSGIIEMLLCATLWSIAGILIKLVPWNGFAVASMRSLVAGITILVYMLITGKKLIFEKKTVASGILTGCVYICFVCANKLTTAANAIVLQFTSPVFIVVLSALFLKTRIRRIDLITVIVTLAGIAIVFLDELEPGHVLGNAVAVLSGLLMAGMFMTVGSLEGDRQYSAVAIAQMFTFLAGLPFVIATKPVFSTPAVLSILALGVFQLGISYILYIKSSRSCPPLACCLLGVIEPLLNPVWVMLFDGETPGILALIGGVIVVVTVTVWCILDGKKNAEAV